MIQRWRVTWRHEEGCLMTGMMGMECWRCVSGFVDGMVLGLWSLVFGLDMVMSLVMCYEFLRLSMPFYYCILL